MTIRLSVVLLFASSAAIACTGEAVKGGGVSAQAKPVTRSAAEIARADSIRKDSIERARIVRVPTPEIVRGLYVNRWAALGRKMEQLIELAKKTEVNALVIDVKDDRGFVLYKSKVPLAVQIGADTNMAMSHTKLRAILDTMAAHNIYPIARIVVAKDPLLASAKLEWAIKRRDNMQPWMDKNGKPWLDPHNKKRFWIAEEKRWVTLKVSGAGLRFIAKNGILAALKQVHELQKAD